METIGAYEAKTRLGELLGRAEQGESFEITKHGHPVARIVPINSRDRAASKAALERLLAMKGMGGKMSAEELKAMIHEGHRY